MSATPKSPLLLLRRWASHLTAPSHELAVKEKRQQARMLASITMVLLASMLIIVPVWIHFSPQFQAAPFISAGIFSLFILVYGFSRTRYYQIGAALLTLSILGMIVVIYFTAPGAIAERMLVLMFLIIPILISSLFFRRFTAAVVILSLGIVTAFFFLPGVPFPFALSYVVFFLVVNALGTVFYWLNERYKRQLFESEEKYRTVVAALSEGIVLLTQSGAIEACNTAAELILGISAEEMVGRNSMDPRWQTIYEDGSPFPGEEHPAIITLRTGSPLHGVIMGVHQPDGELRWISINSQPLMEPNASKPYAVVTSFTDITARKQNERAVQEAQHRYYALFEQAHDAVFILDLEGNHLEANHRAAELLGYSAAEIQKLKYSDLSAEVTHSKSALEQLLAGFILPVYERTFRKKDGSLIPVEINVELVRDLDGNPQHIQSVVRDITERKQTQQRELEFTLEKERTQMLTTFIQNASHEFKTPLSIIETTAFVMARLPDADKRKKRVIIIKDQVKRLNKLINTLLSITGLDNNLSAEKVLVDVGKILETACQRMAIQGDDMPELQFTREANLPLILGYPDKLAEAIWQILDNACRFSTRNGKVTAVSGTTEHHVWLEIHDSGPGILPENLPRIFDMFWREDEAHSTPGFGLGLTIAQKIIHAHGGRIDVTNELTGGATFRIVLPIT